MLLEPVHATGKKGSFVIGVDVDTLIYNVLGREISITRHGIGRRGVFYLLVKDGLSIGTITLGIFSGKKAAFKVFNEHLTYTSMGPSDNLSKELGNKSFGWGKSRILFVRDNAVVSLSMRLDLLHQADLPLDTVLTTAKAIDGALAEGARGVQRSMTVRMPCILEVEAPEVILAGREVNIKIHVAVPEDTIGDCLGFVDRMGAEIRSNVPITDKQKEVKIIRNLRFAVPRISNESEKMSFEVCYATSGCIIVSNKFDINIVKSEEQ